MSDPLPNRIRELRKARGLYLEQLASRVGCSVTFMSDLERGVRDLGFVWLKRIAKALKVEPADLLNEADNSRALGPQERELVDLFAQVTDEAERDKLLQMVRVMVGGATAGGRSRAGHGASPKGRKAA